MRVSNEKDVGVSKACERCEQEDIPRNTQVTGNQTKS